VPHGERTVGSLDVVALCDGIAESESDLNDSFPGVSAEDWARYRRDFPDAFSASGGWRFHIHAFLIHSERDDLNVLVDTGIGPPGAPGRDWAPYCGRLLEDLHDADLDPDDVDVVVLTHLHDDHIGGTVTDDGRRSFPEARYLMHRVDFEILDGSDDPEDLPYRERLLQPLVDAGALEFVEDGHRIADGITVLHTPGHTPGHVSVLLESNGERALVAGDVVNHPGQIQDRFPSGSDDDPEQAAETRERMLSRVERERMVVATGHLQEPFGLVELQEQFRVWRPI
jgi:glyoxylase-like metal-dependent hydrolase (beta-lactamase superfamily II)